LRLHLLGRIEKNATRMTFIVFTLLLLQGISPSATWPLNSATNQHKIYTAKDGTKFKVETILSHLAIPWSIAFDRAGNLYFTERPGRLQVLRKGKKEPQLIASLQEVRPQGEGGLMGLALHPDFEKNGYLYLSYTYRNRRGIANKVVRYRLQEWALADRKEIIGDIPGSVVHNGCRLKFGPDRKLYITTGDAADREIAQDLGSLGGKILRLNDDGSIPSDNPNPNSPIYTFGMRNPQGLAWHPVSGVLFETEHGPSGFDGPGGGDEVNIIEAGKNYGWPIIHHREKKQGLVSPFLEYTPAVAPAGALFYRGETFPSFRNNLFFGCLRGERIERVVLSDGEPYRVLSQEALLSGDFRRIRDVTEGPDGCIYFSTSNQDGRAEPFPDDDRILRLEPVH
jgi:glucose/arabinose dehydrogenase